MIEAGILMPNPATGEYVIPEIDSAWLVPGDLSAWIFDLAFEMQQSKLLTTDDLV
jgi:hypothetical protein